MIIACSMCKREFDNQKARKQHEKDAHPEGWAQYQLNQAKKDAEERAKVPP